MTLRVGIVEDESDARELLRETLEGLKGSSCVMEAADARSALRSCREHELDVLLVDLRLPDMPGLECARQLTEIAPRIKVIAVTAFARERDLRESLRLPLAGFLTKPVSVEELRIALRVASQGGTYLSPGLRPILDAMHQQPNHVKLAERFGLTMRQLEVLHLLALGLEYKEIADRLSVSVSTVNNHLTHIRERLGVHNSIQALNKIFPLSAGGHSRFVG